MEKRRNAKNVHYKSYEDMRKIQRLGKKGPCAKNCDEKSWEKGKRGQGEVLGMTTTNGEAIGI